MIFDQNEREYRSTQNFWGNPREREREKEVPEHIRGMEGEGERRESDRVRERESQFSHSCLHARFKVQTWKGTAPHTCSGGGMPSYIATEVVDSTVGKFQEFCERKFHNHY